ncbi:MAG: glutamate 5-kinase [Peptoniphilaceae bacterium]|nr:glutamate 5-kinase [Peptoniphilaceae bacterium]MDY4196137.1 glutamate 5-kinase [Peptoniphilaceae bacterium]MDY5842610.1 glutamate 5-kinase [Peptoniphilaceae bacterium]MDY6146738.1 glutamate 5-kinase [Peptoniphilaceae bacterium]
MKHWKRFVVKVGSSTICHENGTVNFRFLDRLARVLSDLKNLEYEIAIVSSGAVAVGFPKMGLEHKPQDIPGKQAAAAVGQCELMFLYDKFFGDYGHTTAQLLLTRDVIENEIRHNNVLNTFQSLFASGVIPIINENDTVAYEEIVFGDNDSLSAIVASLVGADGLVLCTDTDGLYTANPKLDPSAKRIPIVHKVDASIEAVAGGVTSMIGTGGMITKVHAARYCMERGIETVIMQGQEPELLYQILEGKNIGTRFIPSTPEEKEEK